MKYRPARLQRGEWGSQSAYWQGGLVEQQEKSRWESYLGLTPRCEAHGNIQLPLTRLYIFVKVCLPWNDSVTFGWNLSPGMYYLLAFSALCIICWLLGQSKYIQHGKVVLHSPFIFMNVAWHHMLSILEFTLDRHVLCVNWISINWGVLNVGKVSPRQA